MTKRTFTTSSFRVLLEYVCLLLIIVVPLTVQAGLFDKNKAENTLGTDLLAMYNDNLSDEIIVLSAATNPDSVGARGGAEILVQDGALVSAGPVGADIIASNRTTNGEISIYTVRAGDTLSHIAEMYGVSVNTILWANDLAKATSVREGQTLVILPISGVRYEVKKGDSISSIAKKFEGDTEEILAYNQLASASELKEGLSIVIPGGLIHQAPTVSAATPTKTTGGKASSFINPAPGSVKSQGIHGYNAVDLAGKVGMTVRAAAAGQVIVSKSSGWNGGYGQYVVIKHSNGTQTLYAHLSANKVAVGAYVEAGQTVGLMGNTGLSTGPHLHFEVRGATNPF